MSSIVHRRAVIFLLALCAFLFFHGIGSGELWRTESLRAIIGAECLRGGNWIVPTLYGQPLLTKPPGMYVAIALVSWPFGAVDEWTARLPSSLAATGTVFLFFWYFGRCLGRAAGLTAAVILPMSLMWLDKAPSAEIDMLQLFWVAAATLFFLRALEASETNAYSVTLSPCHLVTLSSPWWLAALLCVAGGFLTKWTAPAFFYCAVVPLLWWRGRMRLLLGRDHLLSATLAALVCVAWVGLAVSAVGWDEFADTVSREALQRLSGAHHQETVRQLGANHHRPYPAWVAYVGHPLVIGAMSLPWSAFALLTLWPGFAKLWDERGRRLLQALHCWTWPNLLFWSLMADHSPRYSLPLLPGVSGLAALVWIAWLRGDRLSLASVCSPLARVCPGRDRGTLARRQVGLRSRLGIATRSATRIAAGGRGADRGTGAGRADAVPMPGQGRGHHVLLRATGAQAPFPG
ncbi:MAG: glycosyltransferase family 39 protein [Gemmataceae bacterium]|nr:glycosyltransferase family 39 protein [Gemmataceae bacterium]